jgi:hypothetical protein
MNIELQEMVLRYYEFQFYPKKESLVYLWIFSFLLFPGKHFAHLVEMASWRISVIALVILFSNSIGLN